jgi:hypothetical protein
MRPCVEVSTRARNLEEHVDMRLKTRIMSSSLLAACLLLPVVASAEKPEKGNAGGKSADHRSERGVERSNTQWQEDSKRGQDRANEVRNRKDDGDESEKARDKREKKNRKEKAGRAEGDESSETRDDRERQRDRDEAAESGGARDDQRETIRDRDRNRDESSDTTDTRDEARKRGDGSENRGFWQRTFGGDDPE